jgi:hypothetical protein
VATRNSQGKFMLPNFICVGPGRAGTSWLYEVLLEHPQIGTAKNIKETYFFDRDYNKGLDYYEQYFKHCKDMPARGEITNRYIFNSDVPGRIKAVVPDCKIIICLRNPYDRIQSVYSFQLREGGLDCPFSEALERSPALIQENKYYTLIKPYFDIFEKNRIFLIFFDDILNKPEHLCKRLFRFLDVDATYVPKVLNRKVNQAIKPKYTFVPFITKGLAELLRKTGMHQILTRAKRSDFIKKFLFDEFDYKQKKIMSCEDRKKIDRVVIPELKSLENFLGQDLSSWMEIGKECIH